MKKRGLTVVLVAMATIVPSIVALPKVWGQLSPLTPPLRTYSLSLPPNEVWRMVTQTLSESRFDIKSEDPSRFKVLAIGKPYDVPMGFSTKRERHQITIEIQQKRQGVYECFVTVEVLEFWPINNKWTPRTENVDTEETLIYFGSLLTRKLRPYAKPVSP
jgi:hypothetical protein